MTSLLQIPGGPELVIALSVLLVPLGIAAAAVIVLRRRAGRIDELEARVSDLETELQRRE